MKHRLASSFVVYLVLACCSALAAQEESPPPAPALGTPKTTYVGKPELYPLATCVVSGEPLDADAVTFLAGGHTFKTCCNKCRAKVEKSPVEFVKKLEAAARADQAARYPLTTCVVSKKELGSMGAPVQLLFDGTLVQLCCSGCTKRAQARSAALVQEVREAAYHAQRKSYPLQRCVVSGEELGKDAVDVMFGSRLVRFCCEKCVRTFEQDPAKYLPQLAPKEPAKGDDEGRGKDAAEGKGKERDAGR